MFAETRRGKTNMPNSFLIITLFSGGLLLLNGCETTKTPMSSAQEASYSLAGDKFAGGDRVRRLITFEGYDGRLDFHSIPIVEDVRIEFMRYQVFDEFDPVFEAGRKVATRYNVADDFRSATIQGGDGSEWVVSDTSPLRGYTIEAKHGDASWRYSLIGERPSEAQEAALKRVIYHTKSDYPNVPMRIGSTWTHSPLFVNAFLRREVQNVTGEATFTFKDLREIEGEKSAVIGIELTSIGNEVLEDGSVSEATLTLKGETVLSLETFLETSITLEGEMTGSIAFQGNMHRYTSPVKVVAYEAYVEGGASRVY